MGDRKWEELEMDCLVNIFAKVGLETLVDGVQFVCKSWYEATLNPLCWQSLVFPEGNSKFFNESRVIPMTAFRKRKLIGAFAKFVIRRSQGLAKVVHITYPFSKLQVIKLIGEGCPSLKRLLLDIGGPEPQRGNISSMICKWKKLEVLNTYGLVSSVEKVIGEISIHCKNFVSLSVNNTDISRNEAYAIANLLPNIQFLCFNGSWIHRTELVTILKGCRKLMYFDAGRWSECEDDDEIKNLSAHIATFKFDATVYDYGDGYESYDDLDRSLDGYESYDDLDRSLDGYESYDDLDRSLDVTVYDYGDGYESYDDLDRSLQHSSSKLPCMIMVMVMMIWSRFIEFVFGR